MAETADDDRSFYCSQFVYPDNGRNAQAGQHKFRVGGLNGIIGGSERTAHNAGNRHEHKIVAELPLGHDHGGTQGGTRQIGEWKLRQDHIPARERWVRHTGSPSSAE